MAAETLLVLNLVTYSLQLAVLLGVGALLPHWLRLVDARVALRYWQGLLAAMAVLLLVQLAPTPALLRPLATGSVEVWTGGWVLADAAAPNWVAAAQFVLAIVLAGACLRQKGWAQSGRPELRGRRRSEEWRDPLADGNQDVAGRLLDAVRLPGRRWPSGVDLLQHRPRHYGSRSGHG